MSQEVDNGIDPSWWAAAFDLSSYPDGFQAPETLSFDDLLKAPEVKGVQQRVLEALSIACSAMLIPDNWLELYEPALRFGSRRSAVPDDLEPKQLALLAHIAPLIAQPVLRARVADVAWFYGDRGDVQMLDLAIDAYRAIPLERRAWLRVGRGSWRRAVELGRRRGKAGRQKLDEIAEKLQERILASDVSDSFMIAEVSDLLRSSVKVHAETSRQLGEHYTALAATAVVHNPRLARRLEREAYEWFMRCSDQSAAHGCIARVVDAYVAEADQRLAVDSSAAVVVGHFLEKAIATIRELPRKYREAAGLDARSSELRVRLADIREATLEAMIRFESDPVDLSRMTEYACEQVAGKSQLEALARFSTLHPMMDPEQERAAAKERIEGSLAHLFGRATFSADGRKVAASPGGTPGVDDEGQIWSEVVRSFSIRIGMVGAGLLLLAQQILTLEHRYSPEYMVELCSASPFLPAGHIGLWARGLWQGLNGDYPSAASLLVPQLENLVRQQFKQLGVHTLVVDGVSGVETEKGLGALLAAPEASTTLGVSLTLELRALLTEQEGMNLRNHIAHGLFNDREAWSYSAVYAWWLCLRLVVVAVWEMSNGAKGSADDAGTSS